jgi:hypothetical protein
VGGEGGDDQEVGRNHGEETEAQANPQAETEAGMLIRPRPHLPEPWLYSAEEYARHRADYEVALAEWHREKDLVMLAHAIPVVCVTVMGIALALVGPWIVLDMIRILAQ